MKAKTNLNWLTFAGGSAYMAAMWERDRRAVNAG